MANYYPVFLDLKGKRCIVVGGGAVAERKVGILLEHEASVTVISPTLCAGLQQLAEQSAIQVITRKYRTCDLQDAFLVIAATSDATVNAAVAEHGKQHRTLVNVVDDPRNSDFIVPSIVRRGDITIAIATAGKSPALARKLRTNLEAMLPAEYASVAAIVSEVRKELSEQQVPIDSETWQKCLNIDLLLGMVKKGQLEEARRMLLTDLLTEDTSI